MRAKCHDCCGGYIDGREDCGSTACPLYPWMPYAANPPDLAWMEFNPKRVGNVTWEESGREMTDEDREAAARRLEGARHKFKKKRETIYEDELAPKEDDDE
jgi:hypothetical protein